MMTLRFDGRDLSTYAEPIRPHELHVGAVYFFVDYVDPEMLVPTMATVVCLGENLEPGDTDVVYFQDIDSYNRGVTYQGPGDGDYALFHSGSKDEINHVFSFDHAIDELLRCALRRNHTQMPPIATLVS